LLRRVAEARRFSSERRDDELPVSKQKKEELVAEYRRLLERSRGLVLTEYAGISVKELEGLRRRVGESGGEFHVVKNRLLRLATEQAGVELPPGVLSGSTAVGFALEEVPPVAKAIVELARASELLRVKGAVVEGVVLDGPQLERLADLPPLPVLRAQLLGVLRAPAGRLAGALAGSVRQVVNVLHAYGQKSESGAPA
jgi:large subunit ribosomal protein L10